ncbi:hypothetical protein HDU77_007382 [Chytriomyces hyalinus]|nr:hypothetical protein HDU77_007382 [Chytriomyces hyalinus]
MGIRFVTQLLLLAAANAANVGRNGHHNPAVPAANMALIIDCQYTILTTGIMTCRQIADLASISLASFVAINPKVNCAMTVPKGSYVCVPEAVLPPSTSTQSGSSSGATLAAAGTAKATGTATAMATSAAASSAQSVTTASEAPAESPSPSPSPAHEEPPKGDPCGYITSIADKYSGSNDPATVLALHNEIRAYTSSVTGQSLGPLSWDGGVAGTAYSDAVYSVSYSDCASNGLSHSPDFPNVALKSLGWSDFVTATKLFISNDEGFGSECSLYFNYGNSATHFGNMVAPVSSMGCAVADCAGGMFGGVVACDYA